MQDLNDFVTVSDVSVDLKHYKTFNNTGPTDAKFEEARLEQSKRERIRILKTASGFHLEITVLTRLEM